MKNITKHIPNSITLLNLLSGCTAILFIASKPNHFTIYPAICIFLSALFDLFDGMAARALKVSSPIGKDLDSLADVISFGVVPAMLAWHMLYLGINIPFVDASLLIKVIYLSPFFMAAFSALRLAIFNNDESQTTSFKGLPTPANAMVWASLYLCFQYAYDTSTLQGIFATACIEFPLVISVFAIVSGLLLVVPFRLISAKLSGFSIQKYPYHIALIIASVLCIVLLKYAAAPFILILYFIFSYLHFRRSNN